MTIVDARYIPFLGVSLIIKSKEFVFLTRILIQNNTKTECALEKYAMLETELKCMLQAPHDPRQYMATNQSALFRLTQSKGAQIGATDLGQG